MTPTHHQERNRVTLRLALVQWMFLFALLFAYAFATDRLAVNLVSDSASYIEYPFDSLDAALRSTRTPAYPMFLSFVTATFGITAIPLAQLIAHSFVAFFFILELRQWRTPNAASWVAGLAVAFGCTMVDNVSTVSTDCLAASVGVLTTTLLMRWIRLERRWLPSLPVALLCVVSIAIRPAYLAIIPFVAIAGTVITFPADIDSCRTPWLKRSTRAFALSVFCFVPIVLWMSMRNVLVGDFGLLPFGHQNLAGITVQLVNDEELLAGDPTNTELAEQVVIRKREVLKNEPWLAIGDAGATMTIENRWDSYVWHAVVPAAASIYGSDSIVNHRAIRALNQDVISRFPLRYGRWLVLAARRSVWGSAANMLMQPVFLFGVLIAVLLQLWSVLRPSAGVVLPARDAGLDSLFLVAVCYFVCMAGFVILTSPPLGRFVDATAIFIPAWVAGRVTLHFCTSLIAKPV